MGRPSGRVDEPLSSGQNDGMKIRRLHSWSVDYQTARSIQDSLRDRVVLRGPGKPTRLVAGADVSYAKHDDRLYAGVVVLRLPDLELVAEAQAAGQATFPYIPGLLTFREAPVLLEAIRQLRVVPDAFMFDGQGIAHPRGMGLATHIGLFLDLPSVGCAKSRLIGEHDEVGPTQGDWSPLCHEGRTIGAVVRTRENVKPVFVSPGHRMTLAASVRLVLRTVERYRLPEPTRLAHLLVNRIRKSQ